MSSDLNQNPQFSKMSVIAKYNKQKIIGTPDYIAPEIIKGEEQSYTVDWWALGIILYELLLGATPFTDKNPQKVFENILDSYIEWPGVGTGEGEISPEAFDLMKRLLEYDPTKRLGSGGANEIMQHPFFKEINWSNLRYEDPPFVPEPKNIVDTQYFAFKPEESELVKNATRRNRKTIRKDVI